MKELSADILLSGREYLLDISSLRLLPALVDGRITILVSPALHEAMTAIEPSQRYDVVAALVSNSRKADDHTVLAGESGTVLQILDAYAALNADGRIRVIPDEESGDALRHLADDASHVLARPLRRQPSRAGQLAEGVLHRHVRSILAYSANHGTAILMKNRSLALAMRGRAAVLELADRLDVLISKKQELTGHLFGERHRKLGKFFVGGVLTAGGIWVPALAVAGILFFLLDP